MDDFKNISIRGRVAYLLCSLEKLLVHHSAKTGDWEWILGKLWQYTDMEWLDDWADVATELLPECILECEPEEFDLITESEYHDLRELYSRNPDSINKMMKFVHYVGTQELYGGIPEHSPITLAKMHEAVSLMKAEGIEPPDPKPFEKYAFSENGGWGRRFDSKKLSRFCADRYDLW